jgi:hypothetical protein
MDAQTINQTYDLLTLVLIDTPKLRRAGAFYIGPCPFCGGRDRFNLKATPEGWRWFCRKCGDDKYHGPIDYIMRRDNLDFKQALESLGGTIEIRPREIVTPQEPDIIFPDLDWQKDAWRKVDAASERLAGEDGAAGRRYLRERGISRGTISCYRLGLDIITKRARPAIVIPWFDDSGHDGEIITAIKYRFIDDLAKQDKGQRFRMADGSKPILFGLHAAAGRNTLILIEGEINAMSIMQISALELPYIDALSFGSQSGGHQTALKKVAQDYRRVIVWADDSEKAKEIRSQLDRPADALCSPEIEGQKYDANELLQKSWLGAFLREAIQ